MAVYFTSDFSSPSARDRRVSSGRIAALARGVWTDEVKATPQEVVKRHWVEIVGHLLPGAVVTDRSGFTLRPEGGTLFVSHSRRAPLELPGLTVHPDGRGVRRDDDVPLDSAGRLFGASRTRALVDNAETRGRPGAVRRRLTAEELHEQIARIVATSTTRQLTQMLADISNDANKRAAATIRELVAAAQGQRGLVSSSRAMAAAQRRKPYDHGRVAVLRRIVEALDRAHLVQRFVNDARRARHVPFYEAYFSNYIEGSTLTVGEAERVVFGNADVGKPNDAHDIRATWEIVSDDVEMSRLPATSQDFLDALRDRHTVMMAAHPDKSPGQWKSELNRAGATTFVDPVQVAGTLRAGWEEGQRLADPFQRAVYMMFLVSEVHPFADGNGRSARVAMNAELVPHRMHRIIIPTVLRTAYMSGLVRATADNGPEALYRVLDRAQQWVAVGEFESLAVADRYLRATNALWDSAVAERQGLYLKVLRPGELWELPDTDFPGSQSAPQRSFLDEITLASDPD